jgi:hypothetical protein
LGFALRAAGEGDLVVPLRQIQHLGAPSAPFPTRNPFSSQSAPIRLREVARTDRQRRPPPPRRGIVEPAKVDTPPVEGALPSFVRRIRPFAVSDGPEREILAVIALIPAPPSGRIRFSQARRANFRRELST